MDWIIVAIAAIFVIGVIAGIFMSRRPKSTSSDAAQKQNLSGDAIDQLIASLPRKTRNKIENELQKGKTIGAIKLFREATNAGLKEAKDGVEKMMRNAR